MPVCKGLLFQRTVESEGWIFYVINTFPHCSQLWRRAADPKLILLFFQHYLFEFWYLHFSFDFPFLVTLISGNSLQSVLRSVRRSCRTPFERQREVLHNGHTETILRCAITWRCRCWNLESLLMEGNDQTCLWSIPQKSSIHFTPQMMLVSPVVFQHLQSVVTLIWEAWFNHLRMPWLGSQLRLIDLRFAWQKIVQHSVSDSMGMYLRLIKIQYDLSLLLKIGSTVRNQYKLLLRPLWLKILPEFNFLHCINYWHISDKLCQASQ